MVFGLKKKKPSSSQDNIYPPDTVNITTSNGKNGDDSTNSEESSTVETGPPKKPISFCAAVLKALRKNILLILTITSVCFGIGLGFLLRATTHLSPKVTPYFGYPGELFLRGLKFIILPLVASSLICGIAGLGLQKTGKVALRAVILYFTTTFSAVIIGLVLVSTIRPGYINRTPVVQDFGDLDSAKLTTVDTFMDLLRNLIPDNMVAMTFQLYSSSASPVYKYVDEPMNSTNGSLNLTQKVKVLDYYEPKAGTRAGLDVLGLVVFCITFGAMLATLGPRGDMMIQFFEIINEVSIKIIRLMMWFSPIGISSLVCVAVLEMKDPLNTFKSISYYMLTVLVGLAIQGFILLPALYLILTRKNVLRFGKNMTEALMVAFATASSAATLPITFKCIEEKNKIPKVISRFVLPVGATVNLDGTALYEAVAAIFIAQMSDIKYTFVDLIVTSVTATLASIGAAGIPSAGLVTMIIVLSALNIPATQISLIYAVDWLLDRFRTMINVWGDSTVTAIVAHLSRREVAEMERQGVPDLDEIHIPGHAPLPQSGGNKKKAKSKGASMGPIEETKQETIEGRGDSNVYNVKAAHDPVMMMMNSSAPNSLNSSRLTHVSYPEFIDKGSQYQIKF